MFAMILLNFRLPQRRINQGYIVTYLRPDIILSSY